MPGALEADILSALRPRPSASDSHAKYMASALAPAKQTSETLGWKFRWKLWGNRDSKVFVGDIYIYIYMYVCVYSLFERFLLFPFAFPQWTKGNGLWFSRVCTLWWAPGNAQSRGANVCNLCWKRVLVGWQVASIASSELVIFTFSPRTIWIHTLCFSYGWALSVLGKSCEPYLWADQVQQEFHAKRVDSSTTQWGCSLQFKFWESLEIPCILRRS